MNCICIITRGLRNRVAHTDGRNRCRSLQPTKKQGFTLVELPLFLVLAIIVLVLAFAVIDVVFSTKAEPIEMTVTKLEYQPPETIVSVTTTSDGIIKTDAYTVPAEYMVICESTVLYCHENLWKRIRRGDRVVVLCNKTWLTNTNYITDWFPSSEISAENIDKYDSK